MFNFIIRFITMFIPYKQLRKSIRSKYLRKNKFEILEEHLTKHIDKRLNNFINSFYTANDVKNNNLNLKIIQTANDILLKNFKRICDKYNIEYWLDWGTLLGAARHKGFIPWDDDVDVSMTRSSFSRLQEAMKNEPDFILTEWLHLDSLEDPCRVKKFCFRDSNIHSYVDIFLYDYCICSDKNAFYDAVMQNKEKLVNDLIKLNMPQYSCCPCNNPADLKKINQIFDKYINIYSKEHSGNCLVYGIEAPYNISKKILDVSTIFPLNKIYFNEVEYSAPNDIHKFLTTCYGNYMMIPVDVGENKHLEYSIDEIDNILALIKKYEV